MLVEFAVTKGLLTTITEEKVALVVGHSSSAQLNNDIGNSNSSASELQLFLLLFEDLGMKFLHFLTFYSTFIDIKDSSTPASA